MNVDGLEWLRPKWKGFGATYFKWSAKKAVKWMDLLVTDADEMQKVYEEQFGAKSVVITYGAEMSKGADLQKLTSLGLIKNEYYLIVGRMIPDNNADLLIEGFIASNSTKKLVIVGDVPYKDSYANKIYSYKDERLVFTGYITDQNALATLYTYCYVYLHGHEFGGTNPTLLKALYNKCAIAALDTPFSREVLQGDRFGYYFTKQIQSIKDWFNWAAANEQAIEQRKLIITEAILPKYTWEKVTELYLYYLKALARKKGEVN